MAVSTARPGVRRGYVSEKSQRRLLIAVLVAALMPTAYATCATADERHCTCPIQGNVIECYLGGNYAQVPPFRPSNNVYDTVTIRGKSSSLTMQAGAFKNIKMERIEILFKGTMSLEPGAFAGVDGELSELTIGKTLLESIPDEAFAGLGQLTYLNLDQNHLKTVTHRMFSDLSKLEELNLNNNQIVTIHDNAFDDLGQLRYLYIGNNRLKAVNHTMFSHLSHLEVLVLYDNQLETIHDDAFLGLAGLLHLSLLKNRLSSLSVSLARTMSHLERVDLRDNPLVCDCQLAWLQTRAKRINVYGVCTNPPTARGQSVASYDTSLCSHDNTTNTGIPRECQLAADGRDYRGVAHTTKSGLMCQRWDSQTPHEHDCAAGSRANYCNNNFENTPRNCTRLAPWCYTTDPGVSWEYCDIPRCEDID